jgi:GDP-4-dehydro-6-deoxy-D-mannose reductase
MRLLQEGEAGEIYNIASGVSRTLASIIADLERLSGQSLSVVSEAGLARKSEILELRGDPSKLWSTIGEPPPISFRETLKWMLSASKSAK